MRGKKLLAVLFSLMLISLSVPNSAVLAQKSAPSDQNYVQEQGKVVNIAVLMDGRSDSHEAILETYKKEITNFLQPNYSPNFVKVEYGNWSMSEIEKKANNLLEDKKDNILDNKKADVIIGLGFLSTHYLSSVKTDKIVVKVFDYGTSAVSAQNNELHLPKNDIDMLYSQVLFKKLGIFVNESYLKEVPNLKKDIEALKTDNYSISVIPVNSSTQDFSQIIPSDIDAAYVTPMYHLTDEQNKNLFTALNNRKIVSFSSQGREAIEQGAFAALEIPNRHKRLARQTANNILIALSDKKSSDRVVLPVEAKDAEVLINEKTATKIGVSPKWSVVLNAKVVENVSNIKFFSLSAVLNQVINENPELKEKFYVLQAAKADKYAAYSKFLPTVGFDLMGTDIDSDRAAATMGLYPEKAGSIGFNLQQVLFSDKVLTNVSVKSKLAKISEQAKRETELNLGILTASEYVNFLRAQKLLKAQEEHLINIKADFALVGEKAQKGQDVAEDNGRLQSYMAIGKTDMLKYKNDLQLTKLSLNHFMSREQKSDLDLKDITMDSPELFTSAFQVKKYLDTPHKLAIFEDDLVNRCLEISPELKQIDNAIAAKKREMIHYGIQPLLPDVVFDLQARENFSRHYEGETVVHVRPSTPGNYVHAKVKLDDSMFPQTKGTAQAAIVAKWDVFKGGEEQMLFLKAKNELTAMTYKRENIKEMVENQVRSKVQTALTGYFKTQYASQAMVDAQKGFEEAQKNYKIGKADITDLINAQDKLLEAHQKAINANYDFITGLLWVQRAIGCVDFSNTNALDQKWFKSAIQHLEEAL